MLGFNKATLDNFGVERKAPRKPHPVYLKFRKDPTNLRIGGGMNRKILSHIAEQKEVNYLFNNKRYIRTVETSRTVMVS